jgi:hypothetical protein
MLILILLLSTTPSFKSKSDNLVIFASHMIVFFQGGSCLQLPAVLGL